MPLQPTSLDPERNASRLLLGFFPDPEFETTFRAYANYLEELAGLIGGLHGIAPTLAEGVYRAVERNPNIVKVSRRRLGRQEERAVAAALVRAWGNLRRVQGELDDSARYDEESNAWLPAMGYYATYHAIRAVAIASRQQVPRDHRRCLNLISREAQRGLLPLPWGAWCEGCPQTGTHRFGGIQRPDRVHVLSSPDPSSSGDRLAMLLRTTRQKELDRRFAEERSRSVGNGKTRRNLSRRDKERLALRLVPTTIFDVLWRLRKKSHYDDADVFVLGAAGPVDARRFGEAFALVTDTTLAALEALVAAHAGPESVARAAALYYRRVRNDPNAVIQRRAAAWDRRVNAGHRVAA